MTKTVQPTLKLALSNTWHRVGSSYVALPPHMGVGDAKVVVSQVSSTSPAGFWSIITTHEDGSATVRVDRIGSIPVFYAVIGPRAVIADTAEGAARSTGRTPAVSGEALSEYVHAGYVQGRGTLYEGVFRVEPGEQLEFREASHGWSISRAFSPTISRGAVASVNLLDLFADLDAALQNCAHRLAESRRSMTLWVPLSSGLDSKTVAYYLRGVCPDAVRAFSYGPWDHRDVEGARQVADSFGIPWHHIPTDRPVALSAESRKRFGECVTRNHLTSAMPYMQDWPHLFPEFAGADQVRGGIICPGHSGDVPTGEMNYLPLRRARSLYEAARQITSHHMALWPQALSDRQFETLASRTAQSLTRYGVTPSTASSAGDLWNANNRQSRWLVNSVRGLETVNSSWWMPLWDTDFVDFWKDLPLNLVERRLLYHRFAAWRFAGSKLAATQSTRMTLRDLRRDAKEILSQLRQSRNPLVRWGVVTQRRLRHSINGSCKRLDASGVLRTFLGGIPPEPWTFRSSSSIVVLFALQQLLDCGVISKGDVEEHQEVDDARKRAKEALMW